VSATALDRDARDTVDATGPVEQDALLRAKRHRDQRNAGRGQRRFSNRLLY
jgi:hypothetical protein